MIYSSSWFPSSRPIGTSKNPFLRRTTEKIDITLTNGDKHTIESGFETDLGSIPRIFWSIVSPFGRDEVGYIIHDFLIVHFSNKYDRRFIDLQLNEFQKKVEISPTRTMMVFKGVRFYDWLKKHFPKLSKKV